MQETNYIFDFLVSRADPTLLFAVAVGDMQNNTNLIEFEYDYSTRGMAITKNILFILFVFPFVLTSHLFLIFLLLLFSFIRGRYYS